MTEAYVHLDKTPARLTALQDAIDPATFRRIKKVGLAPGWHCWEVGAGGGSVALFLANKLARAGKCSPPISILILCLKTMRLGN
jgi:cyclopropane fatty-acyl-phospholipid synthase-like methyltransferase